MRPFSSRENLRNQLLAGAGLLPFSAAPYLPSRVLASWRLRRIRSLVDHAARKVPLYRSLYRDAGYRPGDLRTWADFRALPTLSRDALAEVPLQDRLAEGTDPASCLHSRSSGSSGRSLTVFHQADGVAIQGLAFLRMFNMGMDYRPWHRHAYIYTAPFPSAGAAGGLYPQHFIHTLAPIPETLKELRRLQPQVLSCYPSHLRELLAAVGIGEDLGFRPQAVWVNSEMSSPSERKAMAARLGCPVYDEYSTEELTRVASQCRQGRYHVYEDMVHMEVLDPSGAASDGVGDVVATALHSFAMPFIRYRQGDLAQLRPSTCGCGRRFQELESLEGRRNDAFVLPSGRVLSSGFLLDAAYGLLMELKLDVLDFTFEQLTPERVQVELVVGPSFPVHGCEDVSRYLMDIFGEPLTLQVSEVEVLTRTASGKRNPIRSRVSSPQ